MSKRLGTIAILAALVATNASPQVQAADLNGRYQCVLLCPGVPGQFAFIIQNGRELNIFTDGEPSRGLITYPGQLWIDGASAIYSPDGMTIRFDGGTLWQRVLEVPLNPATARR